MSTKNQLLSITGKEEALDLIRKVMLSPFSMAVWQLPNQPVTYALFDLGNDEVEQDIEDLNECFVINAYQACHPPKPLILKGDILLTIKEDKASLKYHPTLSDHELDHFYERIQTSAGPGNEVSKRSERVFDFQSNVADAVSEIKNGNAQKIVLSRFEEHQLGDDFDALTLFEKLVNSYPNAFCHLTNTSQGLWLGASPERLISIDDNRYFSTDALAGTQPLGKDDPLTQVGWTQKEIEEQAMVSRYIIDCFKKIRLREFEEIGPKTVRAGNLAHLNTTFKVDMQETSSPKLGSTMLELLHPTSAVCGYPRDAANQFIKETENYDRELYAGFLGPVGFEGATRLFVNLRCMKVMGNLARLYAGAGITEDSIPEKEMDETQYKLETLLSVLTK